MLEKTKCKAVMSMNPFNLRVKFIVPGSGVKALRRGKYGHIDKRYQILENHNFYSITYEEIQTRPFNVSTFY